MRIHNGFHDHGPFGAKCLIKNPAAVRGIVNSKARRTAGPGESREINGSKFAGVFWVSQEDHLLPLDLAQGVILDDYDFDWQVMLHRGNELAHEHAEPAV